MATQIEEAMVVSHGTRQTNTWEDIPVPSDESKLEFIPFEPNIVYEAIYSVPKKPWWTFWMWWTEEFDPMEFTEGLREKMAQEAGVTKEEMQVVWWSYNNELDTPLYAMQVKYVPSGEEKIAGLITLAIFAAIIVTGFIAAMFFFSPSPKLEELRKLVEEIKELTKEFWEGFEKGVKTVLKYGLPMVIAGGSFYVVGKIISLVGKRK